MTIREHDSANRPSVTAFATWFDAALTEGRLADLLADRVRAPHGEANHPTGERLPPRFVALGAAGPDARAERLHSGGTHGFPRMDTYAFRGQD